MNCEARSGRGVIDEARSGRLREGCGLALNHTALFSHGHRRPRRLPRCGAGRHHRQATCKVEYGHAHAGAPETSHLRGATASDAASPPDLTGLFTSPARRETRSRAVCGARSGDLGPVAKPGLGSPPRPGFAPSRGALHTAPDRASQPARGRVSQTGLRKSHLPQTGLRESHWASSITPLPDRASPITALPDRASQTGSFNFLPMN